MSGARATGTIHGRLPPRTYRVLLALLAVAALGLRLWCVAQYEARHPLADRPVIDEASYDRWARTIAGGEWLGREIFFQEPLYPYALGVVYAAASGGPAAERALARRAQAVLGALTVLLVAALARRTYGERAALLAAAALAFYRPAVWFPCLLLKENLFLPLFALFALVLLATRPERLGGRAAFPRWLALGVLAGLGALLRGNMLVLAPLVVLWAPLRALCERRPWRGELAGSAAVLLGLALALGPVALRNQVVGGRAVLTTSGAGTNFYGGNNLDNPYGVAKEFDWVRGVPEYEAGDWRHEAQRRTGAPLSATETSTFWLRETLRSMREHPLEHARIFWRKLRATLGRYEVPDNHFLEWDARFVPLLAAPLPGFAVWGTLGLAGLLACLWSARPGRPRPPELRAALELAALAAAYLATIVLTVTSERVRIALVPLLLPFAGGALVAWWAVARGRERALPWLAATGAAALLVLVPVFPAKTEQHDLDDREYNRAAVLVRDGADLDLPESIAIDLYARYPATPRVAILRAYVAWLRARATLDDPAAGRDERLRAAAQTEELLALLAAIESRANAQELFRLRALRGAVRQYQGRFDEAVRDFRLAAAFDPEDRDVARRLAVSIANAAMAGPPGAARVQALGEALAILQLLVREGPDADLEALLANVRRERDAVQR